MGSIIKVNEYKDFNNNDIITSDGAGAITLSSGMNTAVAEGTNNTPAFSACLNATQTISDATWTKVQCGREIYDGQSTYDASTNYRFTPNSTGYYLINAGTTLQCTANTIVDSYLAIYVNGVWNGGAISECYGNDSSKETWRQHNLNVIIHADNTSDYYELYAYADPTSGSVNISGNSDSQGTWFNAIKLLT